MLTTLHNATKMALMAAVAVAMKVAAMATTITIMTTIAFTYQKTIELR